MIMDYRESIVGDYLTLKESQYEGEYIARWRGLTVATIAQESQGLYAGQYAITEGGADQESTASPYYAKTLDAAWRHIKNYCLFDFKEELSEIEEEEEQTRHRGFRR